MKPMKLALRIWIAFTAAVSFLMGWAMLAHSGKPAPVSAFSSGSTAASGSQLVLPTLAPIPSLNDLGASQPSQSGLQQLNIQSAPLVSGGGLISRGS